MYLVVVERGSRERRWHGAPQRGVVTIGSALEGDIQLVGHNIAASHVRLRFASKGRIAIDVRSPYGVRIGGRPPRADAELAPDGVLEIGPWSVRLEPAPPSGIDEVDQQFLEMLDGDADDARLVYADSLEERGRLAEAELVRGPSAVTLPDLAARTLPAWRRRFLPMAIEACQLSVRDRCPASWRLLTHDGPTPSRACTTCGRRVVAFSHLGSAREHALRGHPVAVDPAVRRWPDDLRQAVVRRPAIDMGQPARR